MKKIFAPLFVFLCLIATVHAQSLKVTTGNQVKNASTEMVTKPNQSFISIHKEKDSPFEIYQDLLQDQIVIRLKNQFDVLRYEIRDMNGNTIPVKGQQDKNEVHTNLKSLENGRYQLIVDRNNQKLLTEFFLDRE